MLKVKWEAKNSLLLPFSGGITGRKLGRAKVSGDGFREGAQFSTTSCGFDWDFWLFNGCSILWLFVRSVSTCSWHDCVRGWTTRKILICRVGKLLENDFSTVRDKHENIRTVVGQEMRIRKTVKLREINVDEWRSVKSNLFENWKIHFSLVFAITGVRCFRAKLDTRVWIQSLNDPVRRCS